MSILIGIFTFLLILLCVFLILVVLMQKASSSGGLGAAMGGGLAESAFGGETSNVLFKATRNSAIAFFVVSLGLYLAHLSLRQDRLEEGTLPVIPTLEETPTLEVAPRPTEPGS